MSSEPLNSRSLGKYPQLHNLPHPGIATSNLWLEQELKETKEATKEAQDWMGAVDQAPLASRLGVEPPTHQKTGSPGSQGHAQAHTKNQPYSSA
ncbi:hypothetical protein RHS01_08614 [Rhizoctonia solani]|uniref:Uncharacterized protein n=1 Tax=Rhizoctonia solani TaxID=456999 RepID=A0A8H7I8I6_9AGAM|nr:hypothetical protein RHS01_08614 [Rhizoctonia solani]